MTGASRGIGRATALALAETGAHVLVHYGRSAHFPGHAVVLAGYDEELAWLSDTSFEDLQTTSLEGLREAITI